MTLETPLPRLDLTACEKEPIHIPGRVQAHGALFAIGNDGLVRHVSANIRQLLGLAPERVLSRPLNEAFPTAVAAPLARAASHPALSNNPLHIDTVSLPTPDGGNRGFLIIAHRRHDLLIVELEPLIVREELPYQDRYADVSLLLGRLQNANTLSAMTAIIAREIRRITSFDRVLIYQFDENWNGLVIAEDGNGRLPSLLDHRFPAADIPTQARELYRLNRLRLIADRDAAPVVLMPDKDPVTGAPVDLTFATLRSVSPVHIEYMRNMGTASSMSVSILREGQLWGLISCHNVEARAVSFDVRVACDFVGRLLSLQMPALEHNQEMSRRIELQGLQSKLLASMAAENNFIHGLVRHPENLLDLTGAQGAAVLFEDECLLVGDTPPEPEVRAIADWLGETEQRGVFATDHLVSRYPRAAGFQNRAAGLVAISISRIERSYVLWFRPEVVQTVKWGGDPRKPVESIEPGNRIGPRRSFATWLETVRQMSLPWRRYEVDAAAQLRSAVVNIVLEKAEELAKLNAELRRSNQELEAFSYSVSHDLRAPFRHIVGYGNLLLEEESKNLSSEGQRWIKTILESAEYAGTLVDNLLALSRIGRAALHPTVVDVGAIVQQVQREVMKDNPNRTIEWKIGKLPQVQADLVLLRLVFQNLIGNAAKFTSQRADARIEISCDEQPQECTFSVRDNGVGFDMQYVDKLFGVFQRLHAVEEFEGTGIGLATVRRIISRHGGRTWADGAVGAGATFYFTLPLPEENTDHAEADPAGRR